MEEKGRSFKIISLIAAIIAIFAFITGIEHCDGLIKFFDLSKSSESQPSNNIDTETNVITEHRDKIKKPGKSKWDLESKWSFDSGKLLNLVLGNVNLIKSLEGSGKCLKFENDISSRDFSFLYFEKAIRLPCELSFNIDIRYGSININFSNPEKAYNVVIVNTVKITREKIFVYENWQYLKFADDFKHETMKKWLIHISKLSTLEVFIEGVKRFEYQLMGFESNSNIAIRFEVPGRIFTSNGGYIGSNGLVLLDNLSIKSNL